MQPTEKILTKESVNYGVMRDALIEVKDKIDLPDLDLMNVNYELLGQYQNPCFGQVKISCIIRKRPTDDIIRLKIDCNVSFGIKSVYELNDSNLFKIDHIIDFEKNKSLKKVA